MAEPQKKKNPTVMDILSPPTDESKPDYGIARNVLIGALSISRGVRFGSDSSAAQNAWNVIVNLLYGPSGFLNAYEGYSGEQYDQARKFKAYVNELCNHISENKLTTLDNLIQWNLEIKAFQDEGTTNSNANRRAYAMMVDTPEKRVGRIKLIMDTNPSSPMKKRLREALDMEAERLLAGYNK